VCALAIGPLISGVENIGVVAFRKELNFRREFVFQISRKLVGFVVVVPLAFWLRSYWALVAGMLASRIAGTAMSYVMHPFRPRFGLQKFREMFRFSRWLLFNNLVAFFKERSSDFFIGRLHGPAALGTYNVAHELAHLPTTEIGAPINRALLPGFAKMGPGEEVRDAYTSALGVLALLALPVAAVVMVFAQYLVPVLLGPKWLAAVPVMKTLAFNGALVLFHSSIGAVLMGRGFSMQVALTNAGYLAVLLVLLFILSAQFGVVGAAYAVLLTSLLCTPIYLYQIRRCLGVGASVFVRAVARPLVSALLTAALLYWALPDYDASMGALIAGSWLLGGLTAAMLLYVVLLLSLWAICGWPDGPERSVLNRLRTFGARYFGSRSAAERKRA
jgi:O-antigen/teichoic acid export membrane protein